MDQTFSLLKLKQCYRSYLINIQDQSKREKETSHLNRKCFLNSCVGHRVPGICSWSDDSRLALVMEQNIDVKKVINSVAKWHVHNRNWITTRQNHKLGGFYVVLKLEIVLCGGKSDHFRTSLPKKVRINIHDDKTGINLNWKHVKQYYLQMK